MGRVNDIWVLSTKAGKKYKRKIENWTRIDHIDFQDNPIKVEFEGALNVMDHSQPPLMTTPNWCSREECIEKTFQNYKYNVLLVTWFVND
jgi:hypothetical protein